MIGQKTVDVKFFLEDPEALTGTSQQEWVTKATKGDTLLEVALEEGLEIEHACGGVCACSTCHIYVDEGMEHLSEAEEDEEDRVEEAPAIKPNSRLSCQCEIKGDGPISIRVPRWNRNAVKEGEH